MHARRENDEVEVDCRNALEYIDHLLTANNDVECMHVRVEGTSVNRNLDARLKRRGHSWSATLEPTAR